MLKHVRLRSGGRKHMIKRKVMRLDRRCTHSTFGMCANLQLRGKLESVRVAKLDARSFVARGTHTRIHTHIAA